MSDAMEHKEQDINLLKLVLAANDKEFKQWPKNNVEFARRICLKNWNTVPSLDSVVRELGLELSKSIYAEISQRRSFINELIGHQSPCHYCGSENDLTGFPFALMKVEKSKRDWSATMASAALSAVAIPLVGAAGFKLPGKSFTGGVFKLRLIVCKECTKKEGNWLGIFLLNEERASHHAHWKGLYEAGFTKFLDAERIPAELQLDSNL